MPSHSTSAEEADERTLLLARDDASSANASTPAGNATPSTERSVQLKVQLGAILFVLVFYCYQLMSTAPETSIREDIICRAYYDARTTAIEGQRQQQQQQQRDCTADDVQRELSLVNQVYVTLDQLPGFLGLAYGIAADRIGRKKVLSMSIIGLILCDAFRLFITSQSDHIPLKVIWVAPLFKLFGGGDAIAATMLLTAIADVSTDEVRITLYARVASVAILCEILGPLVGSALMLKDPWLPLLLGFTVSLTGLLTVLAFMPETLPRRPPSPLADDDAPEPPRVVFNSSALGLGVLRQRAAAMWTVFRQSVIRLFRIPNVAPLMFSFFANIVGQTGSNFELQYLHKRFGWSYPYVMSILTVRPCVTLTVLLVIIPLVSKLLRARFGVAAARKDLLIMRASATMLTAGTLSLCLADGIVAVVLSLVVFALGNGFEVVGKSLFLTLGPDEMAGTLLSAMNLSAAVGGMMAGPLIAVAFDWGLSRGGFWLGTPVLLIAMLYAFTLASVSCVRLSEKNKQYDDEDDE